MMPPAGPLRDNNQLADIRIAQQEALRSLNHQNVQISAWPSLLDRAKQRSNQQDIAQPACHDNQDSLRRNLAQILGHSPRSNTVDSIHERYTAL